VEKVQFLGTEIQDMRRPFAVTLLAGLVLMITVVHLVRLVYAITWWRFLTTLQGNPPLVIALTGLIGLLVKAITSGGFPCRVVKNRHQVIA